MKVVSIITNCFIRHNWIAPEDAPWFCYGLEKRLSTLIIFLPTFGLAVYFLNFCGAVAFFFSFFYLRSYTNGFHASSVQACFIFSIVLEIIFLHLVFPYICRSNIFSWSVYLVSLSLILVLAPYNHPQMALSENELLACRQIVVRRIFILSAGVGFTWIWGLRKITHATITGVALATFLLCLAYIIKGRNSHE